MGDEAFDLLAGGFAEGLRAVLIGAFWGVGHTVTIFVVGAAIILFNLEIPVRVGLSMELSVAVVLIVLGLMNVAGFLRYMPSGSSTTSTGRLTADNWAWSAATPIPMLCSCKKPNHKTCHVFLTFSSRSGKAPTRTFSS